jgi:hypothetical protein
MSTYRITTRLPGHDPLVLTRYPAVPDRVASRPAWVSPAQRVCRGALKACSLNGAALFSPEVSAGPAGAHPISQSPLCLLPGSARCDPCGVLLVLLGSGISGTMSGDAWC